MIKYFNENNEVVSETSVLRPFLSNEKYLIMNEKRIDNPDYESK